MSPKGSAGIIFAVIAVVVVVVAIVAINLAPQPPVTGAGEIKKFTSASELAQFISANSDNTYQVYSSSTMQSATTGAATPMATQSAMQPAAEQAKADDYSSTNIQVAGVDESDTVKNDGNFIYDISGSSVVIVSAVPADKMSVVSTINLSGSSPQGLYVDGDRLVVFGSNYSYYGGPVPLAETAVGSGSAGSGSAGPAQTVQAVPAATGKATDPSAGQAAPAIARPGIMPPIYGSQSSYIKIYDISDRANPVLKRDVQLNGTYYNSRLIGDNLYAIVTEPVRYWNNNLVVPGFPGQFEVYYFDYPDYSYQFTSIVSLNVKDDGQEMKSKVFLLGYSTTMFVSQNNIYLVYQKQVSQKDVLQRVLNDVIIPNVPQQVADEINKVMATDRPFYLKSQEVYWVLNNYTQSLGPEDAAAFQQSLQDKYNLIQKDIAKEYDKSIVHKISISNGDITYSGKGEVPGHPLNQFSMDENNGYFRIATTTDSFGEKPFNNVYVLNGGMNIVGKIEDLAQGERIYSARFMGDRAYLVTYVRTDPLFVIDLSNPAQPAVLGNLSIPGVSDYLHPYDATHIIGVGRSTQDTGSRITFKGLKISLFDVSDVANPIEVAKYEIGDQGTSSDAIYDHKAFLFSKDRNLLVLPISLYEKKNSTDYWGSFTWQGAYVFRVTDSSIDLRGRITHDNQTVGNTDSAKPMPYYWPQFPITRSLYIGNNLYTISSGFIKANSLSDLTELSKIDLPVSYYYPRPMIY